MLQIASLLFDVANSKEHLLTRKWMPAAPAHLTPHPKCTHIRIPDSCDVLLPERAEHLNERHTCDEGGVGLVEEVEVTESRVKRDDNPQR